MLQILLAGTIEWFSFSSTFLNHDLRRITHCLFNLLFAFSLPGEMGIRYKGINGIRNSASNEQQTCHGNLSAKQSAIVFSLKRDSILNSYDNNSKRTMVNVVNLFAF